MTAGSKDKAAASFSRGQIGIFVLTYAAYVGVYFTRKPFSITKSTLKNEDVHTESELGAIDTAFLVTYAIAQFSAGSIEGILGTKAGLTTCFLATGVCAAIFGSSDSKEVRSLTWMINGLFQALFFPLIMTTLNRWFPASSRGRVLGMWTTCQQTGGFAASAFGAYVLGHADLTWQHVFLWPAYLAFVLAFICGTVFQAYPSVDPNEGSGSSSAQKPKSTLSFFQVIFLKNCLSCGGAYFCIKLVRYIFMGWLPFYLVEVMKYPASEALIMSTAFDVAGAFGSIACGFISDKAFGGKSVIVVIPMCLLTGIFAASFPYIAAFGKTYNVITMSIVGFMVAGPDSVLGGAACAEVCEKAGHPAAVTSMSGIVNGMGSVGAIASGMLPILIKEQYGWDALFSFLGGLALCGTMCVLPMAMASYSELSKPSRDTSRKKVP